MRPALVVAIGLALAALAIAAGLSLAPEHCHAMNLGTVFSLGCR